MLQWRRDLKHVFLKRLHDCKVVLSIFKWLSSSVDVLGLAGCYPLAKMNASLWLYSWSFPCSFAGGRQCWVRLHPLECRPRQEAKPPPDFWSATVQAEYCKEAVICLRLCNTHAAVRQVHSL